MLWCDNKECLKGTTVNKSINEDRKRTRGRNEERTLKWHMGNIWYKCKTIEGMKTGKEEKGNKRKKKKINVSDIDRIQNFNETWYGYKSTGKKTFIPIFCLKRGVHFLAAVVVRQGPQLQL